MISIELFPCSGGMAEGFRRAGITFDYAFDIDADACDSYAANLGHKPVQIDVRDLVRMAAGGLLSGVTVDLLVADPPCSPWSRTGKRRGLEDERDMLRETCELIRHLRPSAFLIGNVPGLDEGPALIALRRTIGALARLGYCVDYARLDAANYGVPQHRLRPFWFGHLRGECIRWPAPTHGAPDECTAPHLPGFEPLKPWVSCREALACVPLEDLGRPVRLRWKAYDVARGGHRPSSADAPARTLTKNANGDGALIEYGRRRNCRSPQHGSVPDRPARVVGTSNLSDGNILLTNRKHPINRLDAPSFTVTSKGDGRGAQGACVLELEWPWDRPSTTVTTRPGLPPPGHHPESGSIMSLPDAIVLSERAAKILQGFPDHWTFAGKTKRSRWSQIGMAMPPPLAEAVARGVADHFARSS